MDLNLGASSNGEWNSHQPVLEGMGYQALTIDHQTDDTLFEKLSSAVESRKRLLVIKDIELLQKLQAKISLVPEVKIVIFYNHADFAVAKALRDSTDILHALDRWQNGVKSILKFFHHNRRRTILVDEGLAQNDSDGFLSKLGQSLGMPIHGEMSVTRDFKVSHLELFLARKLLEEKHSLSYLASQLEACSLPLGVKVQDISVDDLIFDLQGFTADRLMKDSEMMRLQEELDRYHLKSKELEKEYQEYLELNQKLKSQHADEQKQHQVVEADERIKNITEENDMVIAQLHSVQEELERYYLKFKAKESEADKLTRELQRYQGVSDLPAVVEVPVPKKVLRKKIRPLFSQSYYQQFAGKQRRPLQHYLRKGWKDLLSPHPLFDSKFYMERNKLPNLKVSPLEHFIATGHRYAYSPHPLFDIRHYWTEYPDVKEKDTNALLHYLKFGWKESRNPHPEFETDWYLNEYPDVKEGGMNPLLHYVLHGQAEGRFKNSDEARRGS
ncbi:MAG: hypothetical protein ACOH5I_21045 [Oligoflexus sp.]